MASDEVQQEKAVPISKNEGLSLLFNLENLEPILCDPDVINKKIAVVAITGDKRSGKSFFLNYILRYLKAKGARDWFGPPDEKLVGFDWSGGLDGVTRGVWTWNKLLPVKWTDNEDILVMLVDTEATTPSNLRDRHDEFYQLRSTYLLPRIGKGAEGLRNYDGRNSELGLEFMHHYKTSIETWFNVLRLQQKRICDHYFTCGDLFKYCKGINQLIMDRGGVGNMSILEVDFSHYVTRKREEYLEYYSSTMEKYLKKDLSTLDNLDTQHSQLREDLIARLIKLDMPIRITSCQREWLTRELDYLYLFLRKDGEQMIAKKATLNILQLSVKVFTDFREYIIQNRGRESSPETILDTLKQARDEAMRRLRDELSAGPFCEALLDAMEAKIAAYGNEVYGGNDENANFYDIWKNRYGNNIQTAAELARLQSETDYNVEPGDFCDALTCILMDDPVMLPNSRTIVDRSTILRHLLDQASDPFNRLPLTENDLIPLPDVKERIEKWKLERDAYHRRTQEQGISS